MNTLYQLKGGFEDPPIASQAVFRNLLNALSMPAQKVELGAICEPPEGLSCAAAAVALTLIDFETPLWISPELKDAEAEQWLRFHCGCPLADSAGDAAFAIGGSSLPGLSVFNPGDAKYPDQSTTLLLEVQALTGGDPVQMVGPGIAESRTIAPLGLPDQFWAEWQDNGQAFQFGIDVFLCAEDAVIGLPRTLRLAI